MSENLVSLEIVEDRDYVYQTRFIGRDGVMLSEGDGLEASYDIGGDEGYVRASVLSSYGTRAWTQPIFIPVWTATT